MLVPLMPFVSASASANASTLINITDTIVNFPVNKMRQGIRRVRQILFFFCEDINKILKSYPFCILYCIKLANDKYTPSINGMINPITKAPTVGIRKMANIS